MISSKVFNEVIKSLSKNSFRISNNGCTLIRQLIFAFIDSVLFRIQKLKQFSILDVIKMLFPSIQIDKFPKTPIIFQQKNAKKYIQKRADLVLPETDLVILAAFAEFLTFDMFNVCLTTFYTKKNRQLYVDTDRIFKIIKNDLCYADLIKNHDILIIPSASIKVEKLNLDCNFTKRGKKFMADYITFYLEDRLDFEASVRKACNELPESARDTDTEPELELLELPLSEFLEFLEFDL